MRSALFRGRGPGLLPLFFFLLLTAFPPEAPASESCAMLNGACRAACGPNESAEAGAFEDCGPKEECCTARSAAQIQCCIVSFEAKDFGPANCMAPAKGGCPKGSPSPATCAKLQMCATAK